MSDQLEAAIAEIESMLPRVYGDAAIDIIRRHFSEPPAAEPVQAEALADDLVFNKFGARRKAAVMLRAQAAEVERLRAIIDGLGQEPGERGSTATA